jgi:hypothetical protein
MVPDPRMRPDVCEGAGHIFHVNDRIEYHDPDDQERSGVKAKQDLWMCLLLRAPTHYPPS